ncbi:E3 ubiquitin-protein ligase TRIM50-like isoform X2 [Anolis carolinensis]|uniref:E3 ubiquitin-protein ligase TRIM50-like isoform X2 n=1 Tax=Anolis carolinensis TaxID=28377 RepID=UPI002F2B1624
MSRKVSLDHLEDHLLCPICLEVFREPLMLPCGHSYCRPCVESLSGGPEARFLCPLCRQSAHAASSPPNVSLARLVEALRTGAHGGEEQQEQQEEESCPDHRNPLSLFCEDDRDVICGLCGTIGTHRHHRLTPLSTAYSRMKEDLSGRMTEVQEQARGLEELLGRLMNNKTRIVNESDVFKWVLRKHFQDLHRFVDEEKARFLGRVERQVGALQAGLEEQQEQAQAALERIRHLQERLTALSDQGQHAFIRVRADPSEPVRGALLRPSGRVLPAGLPRGGRADGGVEAPVAASAADPGGPDAGGSLVGGGAGGSSGEPPGAVGGGPLVGGGSEGLLVGAALLGGGGGVPGVLAPGPGQGLRPGTPPAEGPAAQEPGGGGLAGGAAGGLPAGGPGGAPPAPAPPPGGPPLPPGPLPPLPRRGAHLLRRQPRPPGDGPPLHLPGGLPGDTLPRPRPRALGAQGAPRPRPAHPAQDGWKGREER